MKSLLCSLFLILSALYPLDSLKAANGQALEPTVTQVDPATGSCSGGNSINIIGTNFIKVTAVQFGSQNALSFIVVNSNLIQAVVPPGTGTVDITVTTGVGTSQITSADRYTYQCGKKKRKKKKKKKKQRHSSSSSSS